MARGSRKKPEAAPAGGGWSGDPQYLAFEADIIAHPDDDAPRLILADWLEDHGDEHTAARAEFIRLQIELAGLGEDDPRRAALERRGKGLLAGHEKAWLGRLADLVTD